MEFVSDPEHYIGQSFRQLLYDETSGGITPIIYRVQHQLHGLSLTCPCLPPNIPQIP
jgi:hypothetical protein